jgi:proline iminopeptidase
MPEMRQRPFDDSVFDICRAHGQRGNIFTQFFGRCVGLHTFRLRLHAPFLRLPLTGRHCPASNFHLLQTSGLRRPELLVSPVPGLTRNNFHRENSMPNIVCARIRKNFAASRNLLTIAAFAICCTALVVPAAAAHEERGTTFSAPGATIYYEVFGSGSGTPLFVANGGPGFDHQYLHVSDAWDTLAQTRRIVMWDQRGTGRSGPLKPGQSCTLADQINDLDALRAHLGFDKIDLMGHSWGGFLVMAYAARYPEHIVHLIISDSAAPRWSDTLFLFKDVYPDVTAREDGYAFVSDLNEKDSAAAREASTELYESMLFYSPEHRDEFAARMANDKEYYEINRAVNRDVTRFDLNPEIKKFRFPTMVMCGRFDMNVAPVIAYKIHQAIPRSKFVVFEKSGHMPFFEEPAKFVQVLTEFLSSPTTSTSSQ